MALWPFRRRENRSLSVIGGASAYGAWLADRYGASESGISVNEENALRLLYVFSCINVLSQTLAQIPLRLMRRRDDGSSVPVEDNSLYDMVALSPSEHMSSYVWRQTAEAHRQGWGNCFTRIVRKGSRIESLQLMLPGDTTIRRESDGSIVYDYKPEYGRAERLSSLDVIHVPFIGYDGVQGRSPIQIARDSIGLGMAIQSSGSQFFRNGATVKGVIETEHQPEALSKFVKALKESFMGAQNANQTPILPKGMSYKPVTINPDDAQTLETMKYNRTQICGMYRVPPSFIQDHERSTFTNAAEQDRHFVKYTVAPNTTVWEQELSRKLLTKRQIGLGLFFRHDTDDFLRGSMAERYAAYNTALQGGWMSPNEVRAKENMKLIPGLDKPFVPTNLQPKDDDNAPENDEDDDNTPINDDESGESGDNGDEGDNKGKNGPRLEMVHGDG